MTHLFADIGVAAAEKLLNLVDEVPRHLFGGDIGEAAEGQTDDEHVGMIHVAVDHSQSLICEEERRSTHFLSEFVTSVRTSVASSSNSMMPR